MKITGLTTLQHALCEKIWSMDTQEQLTEWFDSLPRSIQAEALTMLYMITAEAIDDEEISDFGPALAVIDRARQG